MLMAELNAVCTYIQEKTGVTFNIAQNKIVDEHIIRKDKKVYKVKLYFKDFYGKQENITISIRVDITEFDKIYLPVQSRQLIHPYSDIAECRAEIRCIKLEEAMADKLKCLLQRRSSFDLFDLVKAVFINEELAVDQGEIVRTFLKKTIFQPSPVAAKNLLLGIPFDFFKSFWEKHIVCPRTSKIPFDAAISAFKDGLEFLFSDFSYGFGNEIAFFPSNLRNPILQAGSEQTLLKVIYKGKERLFEPYSLTYKRRAEGYGQEYLYVYDRCDGPESNPKSFINSNFSHIENTQEKFEPRWEVELSKAGEQGKRSYFASPFSPRTVMTRSTFRRRSHSGTIYKVKCNYCGKIFRRTSLNKRLNPHKDSYGNPCYGRVGYVVY
jgi:Nucleotidyl transferase AbiEii toxin, Type IV TA system